MKILAPLFAVLALAAAAPALAQETPPDPATVVAAMSPDLRATYEAHAAAVAQRDLAALEPTLTSGERLTLIFPNGHRTDTRQAFIDFHREWFASGNWTMRFDPVSVTETGDTAVILVRSRYEDTADDGSATWSESWVALTFAREDHGWALVFDQNTRIRTSSDPAGD